MGFNKIAGEGWQPVKWSTEEAAEAKGNRLSQIGGEGWEDAGGLTADWIKANSEPRIEREELLKPGNALGRITSRPSMQIEPTSPAQRRLL